MKKKLWTAGISVVFWLVIIWRFDVVYCLNDDLMIQSILSGRYTGMPGGMAVYLAQPLGAVLALFYRICGKLPWLGLFFAGCYAACFAAVFYRMLQLGKGRRAVLGAALWVLTFCALFLPQYLMLHYTVVAAVVGSSGIFLIMTVPEEDMGRPDGYVLPFLFFLLCFLIRRQVFFLLAPFLCAGLFFCALTTKKWKAPILFGAAIAVAAVLLSGLHLWVYGGSWKDYKAFNKARTQLYDYTGVWEAAAAQDYYDAIGVTKERTELYLAYDILLDPQLSTQTLKEMAQFRPSEAGIDSPMEVSLREAVWAYCHRTLSVKGDFPYQYLLMFLYLLTAAALLSGGRKNGFLYKGLLCEALLGIGRSAIWIWLLMGGRFPERVILSLYLIEAAVLFGMLFSACSQPGEKQNRFYEKTVRILAVLLAAAMAATMCVTIPKTLSEQREQIAENRMAEPLFEYMAQHPQNLYLLDVYAVVGRTEYAVKEYRDGYENYLLLGGWIAGSPLQEKKLADWGYPSAAQALLAGENVYLVLKDDCGITAKKLEAFFDGLKLEQVEEWDAAQESRFMIYRRARE